MEDEHRTWTCLRRQGTSFLMVHRLKTTESGDTRVAWWIYPSRISAGRRILPRQGSVYKVAVGPTRSLCAGRVANEVPRNLNQTGNFHSTITSHPLSIESSIITTSVYTNTRANPSRARAHHGIQTPYQPLARGVALRRLRLLALQLDLLGLRRLLLRRARAKQHQLLRRPAVLQRLLRRVRVGLGRDKLLADAEAALLLPRRVGVEIARLEDNPARGRGERARLRE